MKVSVLMSVFNGAKWVETAISSVLRQSHQNFEFIIIDDGSTDKTYEIIANIKDKRIKLYKQKNTGLAKALNNGMRYCNSTWISRIDADDIWDENKLKKQLNYLQKNTDTVVLGTGFSLVNSNYEEIKTYSGSYFRRFSAKNLFVHRPQPPHSSIIFNRKLAQQIGGYRPSISKAEDYDLWIRLSRLGEVRCLPESLVKIVRRVDSISFKEDGGLQQMEDARRSLDLFMNFDNQRKYRRVEKWLFVEGILKGKLFYKILWHLQAYLVQLSY